MTRVKTLVLRAPGTNCDVETAYAFQLAGSDVELIHINSLIEKPTKLAEYSIWAIPGGFTYGDDLGAGRVLANEIRHWLGQEIVSYINNGKLIIGICNGFQTMVKVGILPDSSLKIDFNLTLTSNDSGRFECRWTHLKIVDSSPCIFTSGIEKLYLPVAHAEGKLFLSNSVKLFPSLYYVNEEGETAGYPFNPNGSDNNIAGICDSTGRIFGLMPHPERFIWAHQHPSWTRGKHNDVGDGVQIFKNAVDWAKNI
jgi:phosphoribosylformylglycinamidine synthase